MSNENVQALSVRDLVRRRLGADRDIWHLALVQRDEVWDQTRMRYLLDSLLAGYPIGSLLVCKVTGQSRVLRLDSHDRSLSDADSDAWQLLDGQQRINALFSMFTPAGRYGRFYLRMTHRREPAAGPVIRRRAQGELVRYIHWQEEPEADNGMPEREHHIDLSGWYAWAENGKHDSARAAAHLLADSSTETVQILKAIDPEFADELDPRETEIARQSLRRLLAVWREPAIPVQYLALGSPQEVLEVFTRLNRAGVQVAGQDLFFAAAKTLWNDAEHVVARVVEVLGASGTAEAQITPLVGRLGALRILARLAARAVGQADLVPLTVDRLNGARGDAVIAAMRTLSDSDSTPLRRMAAAMGAITQASSLGFGLYSVDERLWDDVLGWAAVNERVDDAMWLREQLAAIDGYLLGATSFRYPSVLRDQFSRAAMIEALTAGMAKEPFPTQRIAEVTRTLLPNLGIGRQRIRGSGSDEDRLWLADSNVSLFLSVLQVIPYRPQRDVFDWDHIFPRAQANLMWSPGPAARWRRHHQYRRFVGSAGNFWGLDAGANRAAQDKLPGENFDLIEERSAGGAGPIWPRNRWWLTAPEIEEFREIGRLLKGTTDIDPAMDRFHKLVTDRALRMVEEVFKRFPEGELFAGDQGIAGAEPSPAPAIAAALGIVKPDEVPVEGASGTSDDHDDRVERVLRLADDWGSGAVLRDFVVRALRLSLQVRGYQWTLTITPPSTKVLALVSMSPDRQQRGSITTWVAPRALADHFPDVPSERFDEALSGIRGSLLDGPQIKALGDRLEELLKGRAPLAGTGSNLDTA